MIMAKYLAIGARQINVNIFLKYDDASNTAIVAEYTIIILEIYGCRKINIIPRPLCRLDMYLKGLIIFEKCRTTIPKGYH